MTLPGVDRAATERYRSHLAACLDDGTVATGFSDWREHLRRHHGDVFRSAAAPSGSADEVARRLFLDTLTFDVVADGLRRAVEDAFDLTVQTPQDSIDLRAIHRAVDVDVIAASDPEALIAVTADDLRRQYEQTVPAASRRVFGEYYTPPGLAALGVEAAQNAFDGSFTEATVLDPGCGAGAFLTAALGRKRSSGENSLSCETLAETLVGIDVNPVAVTAARASLLTAFVPLVREADISTLNLRVHLGDALGLVDDAPTVDADLLLGNPPWIPWERLTERQKDRLRGGPVDRLGLFSYDGAEARLGHANDDLSLPFVWSCLDRYLRDGGVGAFVLKRDLLRGPAGRVLRSGTVGPRAVSVAHVHDFAALDPFSGVGADAALYVFKLESDRPATAEQGTVDTNEQTDRRKTDSKSDPGSPTTIWESTDAQTRFSSLDAMASTLSRTRTALRPVDPTDDAGPWLRTDADVDALGECSYQIRHGLKDDAKAVFSVDRGDLEAFEPTHLYPYLRSKHVVKWGLFGHDLFLVPQRQAGEDNERELAAETPRTYDYLDSHRDRLESRGSSWFDAGPFYSLFGLGPYTWAPYKVVWCRLGFKPHFAVVSTVDDPDLGTKPVVPGDHCMFIACAEADEAHYLCALLNSAPYQRCLRDIAGDGKASLSKSVVSSLWIPPWNGGGTDDGEDAGDSRNADDREDADGTGDVQQRLADCSRRAHGVVPDYVDRSKRAYNQLTIPELRRIEAEVDALSTRLLDAR